MGALPVAVVSICECVFNAAVSFHVLVEFWMDQGRRVLVREGFTLAVCALRAEIRTVRDLRLLQTNTHWLQNFYCYEVGDIMAFLDMRFLHKTPPDWITLTHYKSKPIKWMWIDLGEMFEFILRFQTLHCIFVHSTCSCCLEAPTHTGLKVMNVCDECLRNNMIRRIQKWLKKCDVNANPSRCFPDNSEGPPAHLSIIHCTKTKDLNFKRPSKDIQTIAVIFCMSLEDASCLTWLFT